MEPGLTEGRAATAQTLCGPGLLPELSGPGRFILERRS